MWPLTLHLGGWIGRFYGPAAAPTSGPIAKPLDINGFRTSECPVEEPEVDGSTPPPTTPEL
jgi:hypothetical protein